MLRVKYAPSEIVRVRLERLLTQEEAAAEVGVAQRTWQNWESGAVTPRVKHMRRLVEWMEKAA